MLVYGLGLLFERLKIYGFLSIAMSIIGPLITLLVKWPSAAVLETFGIIIIDVWVFMMIKVHYEHQIDIKNIHRSQ